MNSGTRRRLMITICLLGGLYVLVGGMGSGDQVKGVSGIIHFRDGRQVPFFHFGSLNKVYDWRIDGELGQQDVNYSFTDISEIHFPNTSSSYNSDSAENDALVVSRSDERFTLNRVYIYGLNWSDSRGRIWYVYQDPITKERRKGHDRCRDISHIVMRKDVGPLKCNPKTREYFPAIYNYDPFTGQELTWTSKPPKRSGA